MRAPSSCASLWLLILFAAGCTSPSRFNWESLKGPGFPGWTEQNLTRTRPGSPAPKPSGHFTDRRSDQIEQDLGGF